MVGVIVMFVRRIYWTEEKKIKMFKKKRYIHDTTSTAIWHRTLGSAGPAHLHTKQLFSILLYSPNPKG